jgi:low affinity Fe/Cu permease
VWHGECRRTGEVERKSNDEPFWAGRFARQANDVVTSPWAPVAALLLVGLALFALPPLGLPQERVQDVHFLVAVATLLLVFLLEHNEDRDKVALHIKLDEVLAALRDADRRKVGVEDLPAADLREIRDEERATVRSRPR